MSSREIALIVFACISASTMLGLFLGKILPNRHLDADSKDIVKLATGLIATLSALVLGLLVSSAKGMFDDVSHEVTKMSVQIVLLDRVLAHYGPETMELRAALKSGYTTATAQLLSGDDSQQAKLNTPEAVARLEGIQAAVRALSPQNDAQRGLQARALDISGQMASSRWLMVMQSKGSISTLMLVIMVFWVSIIFAAWGVFSPRNLVVVTALLACALSVSGATFLILELDQPLSGWIRVSPIPAQEAIAHLGE